MSTNPKTLPFNTICGDIDIRIDATGQWHHEGSPIGRKELVRLFASVLIKDAKGEYWLETPAEKARIQVEDAPFIAIIMNRRGRGESQVLHFETNVGDTFACGPDNPLRVETDPETEQPSPYVLVRDNLEAKIARPVFYDLVEFGIEAEIDDRRAFGVWSGGAFFPLGQL